MEGLIQKQVGAKAPVNKEQEDAKLALQVVRNTLYDEEMSDKVLELLSSVSDVAVGINKAIVFIAVPIAKAMHEDTPDLSPNIWLADGGVLDSLISEMFDMCETAGIPIEDPEAVAAQVKQKVIKDLQQMEGAQQPQEAPEEQLPEPPAAPPAATPQQQGLIGSAM